MRIIITEKQLKGIFDKKNLCLCDDGTYSIECCHTYEKITADKHVSDSLNVINYAVNKGLDLKPSASDSRYKVSWTDVMDVPKSERSEVLQIIPSEYRNYVPEIVSGVDKNFKFDVRLIDILSEIETLSGLDIVITGGKDYFHKPKNPNSKHNIGKAVDFVPINGMNNTNDRKIEEAVLKIMLSGKYGKEIGLINERVYPSGHASGDHFHLSLDTNVEYSNFGFIDMDGISYKNIVGKGSNLSWGNGGPYPKKISDIIDGKQVEIKLELEKEKERIRLEKERLKKQKEMELEKIRLENLFSPLKMDVSVKSYCESLIKIKNENPNDIDKIPSELLIKEEGVQESINFCELVLEPLQKLEPISLKNMKLDSDTSELSINKLEKQIEELNSLENLSYIQLLKKRAEYKKDPSKSLFVYRINQILKEKF